MIRRYKFSSLKILNILKIELFGKLDFFCTILSNLNDFLRLDFFKNYKSFRDTFVND